MKSVHSFKVGNWPRPDLCKDCGYGVMAEAHELSTTTHVAIVRQQACSSVVYCDPDGCLHILCQATFEYCEGFASAYSRALNILHNGIVGLPRGNSAEMYRQYLDTRKAA